MVEIRKMVETVFGEGRRKWVKRLIGQIEETVPQVRNSLLASLQNVRATHLLDADLQERLTSAERSSAVSAEDEDDILRLVTNRPAAGE